MTEDNLEDPSIVMLSKDEFNQQISPPKQNPIEILLNMLSQFKPRILLCSQFFLLLLFIVFGIFALLLFHREFPRQQEQLAGFSVTIRRTFAKKRQQKEATKKSAELSPKSKAFLENEKKNEVGVGIADEPKKRKKGLFDSQTERSEMSTEISEMVKARNSVIQMNEQFSDAKDASVMGRTAKETGKSIMGRVDKTCKETGMSFKGKAEKTCRETGKSMMIPASTSFMRQSEVTDRGLDKSIMGRTAKEVGKSARSNANTDKKGGGEAEKTCREKEKSRIHNV